MTRAEWDRITKAAQLLGLEEQATLDEIKKAFRRLSKKTILTSKNHQKDQQKKLRCTNSLKPTIYCWNTVPTMPSLWFRVKMNPLKVKTGGFKDLARIICEAWVMARSPKDANSLLLQ
jgi:hypothetical protein